MALALTDPTYTPRAHDGLFERTALRFINDPRDLPFVRLIAVQSLVVLPLGVYQLIPGHYHFWLAALYLAVTLGVLLAPFILMLHNTSHRKLFKREYEALNHYIPWVLGPFFGETPETYFTHHVGMHHPENNLPDDVSSTMAYQRDSVVHFMVYFLRFFFGGIFELGRYFVRKHRPQLLKLTLMGELGFWTMTALLLWINWRGALVVFVIPLCFTRFMMMAGNWGQHAFVDEREPGNCYRNSITCINCGYNRRCFNDGYHIAHHIKATRHWTEMPGDLADNESTYRKEGAIVIQGIDFFIVWLLLMLGRYDWIASRVVSLDGEVRTQAEIEALLRQRTRRIAA